MPLRVLGSLILSGVLAMGGCSGGSPATGPTSTGPAPTATVPSSMPGSLLPAATSGGSTSAGSVAKGPCGRTSRTAYRHVIWIWFENRDYSQVLGPGDAAPHLAAYGRRCGVATNYQAVTHPSLPNYIAAVAGRTYGISSDCNPQECSVRHPSLFAQVTASGRKWKSYAESMSRHCDTASYGRYAARHNPAVYFPPIAGQCRRRDVPLGGLHGPLGAALDRNRLPAFAFVTPNLCNDGHDCSTGTADRWLGSWLDRITASRAYAAGRTVVFVTWDEGSSSNHVATVVIGPTVPRGTRSGAAFTHYSLLRTTEQLLGLPRLGHAASARSMRAAFHL